MTKAKHRHRWGKWAYTKSRRQRIRICEVKDCGAWLWHQKKNHEGRCVDRVSPRDSSDQQTEKKS